MPKQIVCNECKENGYITLTRMFNDYCGIGSKPCEACGGKGYFDIPMTNADRIRAMTDEELADYQCRIITAALKEMGVNMIYDHEAAVKIMLRKLQQPYEED